MTTAPELRKGMRFEHKRLVESTATGQPQTCVITLVALGAVHYRAEYGVGDDGKPLLGASYYFPISEADRWIGRIL